MHAELPSYGPRPPLTGADRVDMYLRVLNALMLRDMKTRFFGSMWGYAMWVLWPVAHVMIITVAAMVRKMPPPFGDSVMVFAATGCVPALAFSYISGEIMKGVMSNKPLTYYPQVRILDVAFARIMVEINSSFMAVIVIGSILIAFGQDPVPADTTMALGGYIAAVLLGIGMGLINAAIVLMFPGWVFGWMGFRIVIYLSSGVIFFPSDLPDQIYTILKWNPLLQIVEWVRLGYDPFLPIQIDYFYVIMWVLCAMAIGLSMERTVSRRYG